MFVTEFQSTFPYPAKEIFAFLLRSEVFERLLPPWRGERLLCIEGSLGKVGSFIHTNCGVWEVCNVEEGSELTLKRIDGPFNAWVHTFRLKAIDEATTELKERIEVSFGYFRQKEILRQIRWRHQTLAADLKMLKAWPSTPKRVLVSGASGMIGTALTRFLRVAGWTVVPLVRSKTGQREGSVFWDPTREKLRAEDFEGFDGVVHLAARNIGKRFWTKRERELIFQSRVRDTWLLSKVLSRLKHPPKVVVTASGVGYYGSLGSEELTEESKKGEGFLADLVEKWEGATSSLKLRGVRVVHARMAAVLSSAGGMLGKMLLPFKWCLGGRLGDGMQRLSFVDIDDAVHALYFMLIDEGLMGPVNVAAPDAQTQATFANTLARQLHRIELGHIPAWLLRLAFGEMADQVLLASQHVVPYRLLDAGFEFSFPTLDCSLEHFL